MEYVEGNGIHAVTDTDVAMIGMCAPVCQGEGTEMTGIYSCEACGREVNEEGEVVEHYDLGGHEPDYDTPLSTEEYYNTTGMYIYGEYYYPCKKCGAPIGPEGYPAMIYLP